MLDCGPMLVNVDELSSHRPLVRGNWILLRFWRWALFATLLPIELLVFSIRFDSAPIFNVVGNVALVARLGISIGAALLVFGGYRALDFIRGTAAQVQAAALPWKRLTVHLSAVAVFYYLSVVLLDGATATARVSPVLLVWAAAASIAVISWLSIVFPVADLRGAWSSAHYLLLGSVAIAAVSLLTGQVAEALWTPLSYWTFYFVKGMLGLAYSSVVAQSGDLIIGTNTFQVEIAPQCSGCEGIGLILVFLTSFLWWFRDKFRFPQALLLLVVGVAAIWITNAVRIAALIAIGTSLSPSIAAGGFHSQAGWIAFNLVALALVATAWNSAFFVKSTDNSKSVQGHHTYPAAPYLVPLLVLIASTMLSGAFSFGAVDYLYPVRVVMTAVALLYFAKSYRDLGILTRSLSWLAVTIGFAAFVLWMALEPLASTDSANRLSQVTAMSRLPLMLSAAWIVFRALGSIVIAPLAEELAFRGFLTRRLIAEDFSSVPMGQFTWFSFLVSSAIFGALHGRWLAGTLAGMLFAFAYYRRGRLSDAVVAHATTNGLISIYVLTTGEWGAWS